jgi:myo-inositol catabolism protein IolC
MNTDDVITQILNDMGINESQVADLRSRANEILQNIAAELARHAESSGFKKDISYVDDASHYAAQVEVQLGRRRNFPNSEVIKIEIYDEDNIKILLTDNISRGLREPVLNSFNSVDEVTAYLNSLYRRV